MEILFGWGFYFIFLLMLMIVGYYLIAHIIFQAFEIKRYKPVLVFAGVFSLSIMCIQMLIIEILKVGTDE